MRDDEIRTEPTACLDTAHAQQCLAALRIVLAREDAAIATATEAYRRARRWAVAHLVCSVMLVAVLVAL